MNTTSIMAWTGIGLMAGTGYALASMWSFTWGQG